MDKETLSVAMGKALPISRYGDYVDAFNKAMAQAGISTVEEAAMWCAQLGHESVGLAHMRELWGPTRDQLTYEGRMDLGNRFPGDGFRFRGRGPIQLTGRHNYEKVSEWAHSKGLVPSPTFFVDQPEMLESAVYGFLGTVWYWTVARPKIGQMARNGDVEGVTRAINGGVNGIEDRRARYRNCLQLGGKLLPGHDDKNIERKTPMKVVLQHDRAHEKQDTYYNCGPASTQTVIKAAGGPLLTEADLGRQLGTHTGGTDYIGKFPKALNRHLPGAEYRHRDMPNDPPTNEQKEQLWADITSTCDKNYGVVANIVAPPSNYPKAVAPSTISPHYGGGTVYHYIAILGYDGEGAGRKVWVVDSGFYPYIYWCSFDQIATLIPPKGYCYATGAKNNNTQAIREGVRMIELSGVSAAALDEAKRAAISAAESCARMERELKLMMDQLVGFGHDEKGRTFDGFIQNGNRTLNDTVAAIAEKVGVPGTVDVKKVSKK